MSRWMGFAVGFLAFLAAHAIEVAMWARWFGGAHEPWFLNESHAAGFMVAALFAVSVVAGWYRLQGRMLTAGAWLAMAVVLMTKPNGPGNIAPIVLAFGGLSASFGCGLGAFIGREIRRAVGGLQ